MTTTPPAAPAAGVSTTATAQMIQTLASDRPLRLLITGATGNTGLELVKQALQMGHHVTAICRNPTKLTTYAHERLHVVKANPLDAADIIRVMDHAKNLTIPSATATATVSTTPATSNSTEVKVEDITTTAATSVTPTPTVAAIPPLSGVAPFDAALTALGPSGIMEALKGVDVELPGTRALIAACNHHGIRRLIVVSSNGVGDSMVHVPWIVRPLWRKILAGKDETEKVIRASHDLDWVIVRPTALTNGSPRGLDRIAHIQPGPLPTKFISRADTATFCLAQLTSNEFVGRWPSISWKK